MSTAESQTIHSIERNSHTTASLDGTGKDAERGVVHPAIPPSVPDAKDPYLVDFEPDDSANPQNWSLVKRWYLTALGGILVLNATFASAAPSGSVPQMMQQFGFGREVGALTISIFVAGYCLGPILWGPLSEEIGRRPVFIIAFTFYTGFQIGCALSQNTASIIIFRLLSGIFAAAPLTNSGGLVSDLWKSEARGKALTFFAVAPFAGPALGPLAAGWLAVAGITWRWLFWILTIFAGVCLIMAALTLPETYPPILLKQKAQRLRKETGDNRYYAPLETHKEPFRQRINKILAMPFRILFQEPVLIALTLYMSFIFGTVYLLFEAYPIVFSEGHGFNEGISALMFLPISLGGVFACAVYLIFFNPRYAKFVTDFAPAPVPPEKRLEPALFAGPLFATSFMWFGFTTYPSVSFWSPMMAGGLLGFSILLIFLSSLNFIVDNYLFVAASALAANTVIRSIFGAAFPLFGAQMYEAMNPRWASFLLGCFAFLMAPIPFLLVKYGPALRARSKFAPSLPKVGIPKDSPEEKETA